MGGRRMAGGDVYTFRVLEVPSSTAVTFPPHGEIISAP